MKQSIITISGLPGSGKSTVADHIADKLDWKRFSSGDFMRQMAQEQGVTLSRLSKQAEDNPEIDRLIDAKNKEFTDAKQVVIDSRLAFHFIPDSFSIYLTVESDEAARRIYEDEKEIRHKVGENHEAIEETEKQMLERIDSEKKRYQGLYDLDYTNPGNYDLVIDTTDKGIPEIVNEIITAYKNWQSS